MTYSLFILWGLVARWVLETVSTEATFDTVSVSANTLNLRLSDTTSKDTNRCTISLALILKLVSESLVLLG
jgi:hypothetical protein